MSVADQLKQIQTAMSKGIPLPKALAATAHPYGDYPAWSRLWDVLYDAQKGSPRRPLGELQDSMPIADMRALVERAIEAAGRQA